MAREAKICRGSWCLALRLRRSRRRSSRSSRCCRRSATTASSWRDSSTTRPSSATRTRTAARSWSTGSTPTTSRSSGTRPGPYGDFGKYPWATGGDDAYKGYLDLFEQSVQFCVDCGIPAMRVDPGDFGPLPRDADYDAAWNRVVETFQAACRSAAASSACKMLWEYETGQIFVKPSEAVKLLDDVGDDNLQLMYDVGHVVGRLRAGAQPGPARRAARGRRRSSSPRCSRARSATSTSATRDNNTWQNAFGTHLGIGKGVIDFDELIPVLADSYDGDWWSVDAIPMTAESWADTWTDRFTLDALLDQHVRGGR